MLRKGLVFYTGGKDSHYAIIESLRKGIIVSDVLIVNSLRPDSWMFHTINIELAKLHAKLMGISYLSVNVSGVKEAEIRELAEALRERVEISKYDYLITGAVASRYQKARVDALADELGIKHLAPLWGRNQDTLLMEEISELGIIITAVQAYGLSQEWLGRLLSVEATREFLNLCRKYGISPVGEGGEFETLVLRSPLFRGKGLMIRKAELRYYPQQFWGVYEVKDVSIY